LAHPCCSRCTHCYLRASCSVYSSIFFFTVPAPPCIYTLSLHDALPICSRRPRHCDHGHDPGRRHQHVRQRTVHSDCDCRQYVCRSEEHTSELQSRENLVCRLLLEKKK